MLLQSIGWSRVGPVNDHYPTDRMLKEDRAGRVRGRTLLVSEATSVYHAYTVIYPKLPSAHPLRRGLCPSREEWRTGLQFSCGKLIEVCGGRIQFGAAGPLRGPLTSKRFGLDLPAAGRDQSGP